MGKRRGDEGVRGAAAGSHKSRGQLANTRTRNNALNSSKIPRSEQVALLVKRLNFSYESSGLML